MLTGRSAADKPASRTPRDGRRPRGKVIERDITIVIPAYNEEHRLPATLDRLMAELPSVCSGSWEVLVSDDGSTDGTGELLRDRGADPRLRVVSTPVNRGKGAALVAGALAARHPLVLFLDADLPVPIPTIAELAAAADGAELVVGSRRMPGASLDPPQPLVRRVGGRLFRAAISVLGYDATSDPQCGVKVLRKDQLAPLLAEVTCRGFAFDVELIERARRAGLRVSELPVAWRHVEGSSLRPVRDAVATLVELARLRGALRSAPAPVSGRGSLTVRDH